MRINSSTIAAALRLAWAACTFAACGAAVADPSNQVCETRRNDTAAKLVECIQEAALYRHLVAFQQIADAHPAPIGHGNRDTGTTGYAASVEYVARQVRQAGYQVTVQPYKYTAFELVGKPTFEVAGRADAFERDWHVARLSGAGAVSAQVQPVGGSLSGCTAADFGGFVPGRIALVEQGRCEVDEQVRQAQNAGASAVIVYGDTGRRAQAGRGGAAHAGGAFEARLHTVAGIPVLGVVESSIGAALAAQAMAGTPATAHIDVRTRLNPDAWDYNLIADSPYGDPDHVVVVEGHLDSIHGAGILDNGSGSSTILEIALKLARTPTRNQLRYIWFGGEEIGLFGSKYYTKTLTPTQLARIAFDVDSDVTATPNYEFLIADPQNAPNVDKFPPNVIPESRRGNEYFRDYFRSVGVPVRLAGGGNVGTDSNSFSLVGVPNTGLLTGQDCCKTQQRVNLWGGYLGNYEGNIPSFDGGCVDNAHRWCDNLDNISPYVLQLASRSIAYVTFMLANDPL